MLLEALAHGVPVVATDCPTGPRYVLQGGAVGDLVPVEDPDALATAVLAFLDDPEPLRRKALLGPGRALDFDQAAAAHEVATILAELPERVSRRSSARPS